MADARERAREVLAPTASARARLPPEGEGQREDAARNAALEAALSGWRIELARTLLRQGKTRDPEVLSGAAQRILDRLVFLRLCEELGLEEHGALGKLVDGVGGFGPRFVAAHAQRYRRVYGGLLFPERVEDDPTAVEGQLLRWRLEDPAFERVVRGLYHPANRLDAMPLELLGGVYERFLGKRLRVVGDDVKDAFKPEHQRTRGAVYTPAWLVRRIVGRALGPLTRGADPEAILGLRVLDPACGAAAFLLGAYDHLEEALLAWARAHPKDPRRAALVVEDTDGLRLSAETARRVVEDCLHGVDVDPTAVEVARMSLALRYLRGTARDLPDAPRHLLAGVGRNIRQGDALSGSDLARRGLAPARVRSATPFRWRDRALGFGDVLVAGGFHAVLGNPPYIEVKRYKQWMPELHRTLREGRRYVTAVRGKTDLSMPFMELGVRLLRRGGRLGFVIQNRFFKTEYGAATRRWLREGALLEAVEDFRDLQVFPGRTTYTAILVLQEGSTSFEYRTYDTLAQATAGRPVVTATVQTADLDDGPWSLDAPDLLEVHAELARRHGTVGQHRDLELSVGLQTLYGRLYQLQPARVTSRTVNGVNGLGVEVALERLALRPLCRNRGFYPFRADNADAWVIFPYDVAGGVVRELRWPEFERRFPKAAAYLEEHRKALRDAVEVEDGRDRWHLYTRPQNLVAQARPKVLFPMTIEDTSAAVDATGDVYQDNANVNSLSVRGASVELLAVAAIMNSTLFSALARLKAGLNEAGWRKFNRQFAALVPFPYQALQESPLAARLAELGGELEALQLQLRAARSEGARGAVRTALASLWAELDLTVEQLYGLTSRQRQVVARHPRRVDRVEWPLRAGGAAGHVERLAE